MNKAELSGTLVGIIAAVAAGLVIIGVLIPSLSNAREGQAESLCKTSVAIRAGTAIKPVGKVEVQASPLLCKTLTPTIKADREQVSREIANKMAKCWDLFGAGTYKDSVFNSLNIFGSGKGCFTCYVLPVEESSDFKEGKDNIPAQEFVDFLRTENYPASSNRTYLQYFQTAGGPGNVINLLTERGIEPNHAYAVSYKVGKGTCSWCAAISGGAVVGAGLALTTAGGLLLLIPEPTGITKVIGYSLAAKGLTTTFSGSVLLGAGLASGYEVLDEAAIDTIILSDITNKETEAKVRQACNFVEDIEGKKLR